jgi:hypothetical protein
MESVMRALGLVAAFALVLSGCGGPGASAAATADSCGAAFAAAAGVDQNADTVADLYPAVRACRSVEAWATAFAANNGAGFAGSPRDVLINICTAPEVADTPLCQLVK